MLRLMFSVMVTGGVSGQDYPNKPIRIVANPTDSKPTAQFSRGDYGRDKSRHGLIKRGNQGCRHQD